MSNFYRAKMPTYLESSNDTESPSMSRNEDNLSNSDGPLLKRSLGKNNMAVSSQNVCGTKTILSKRPSTISCRHNSTSLFESTEKRYCLWALTLILAIAGLCNLLLSITVMAVLRVGQGMEAMEVIAGESLVKFYGRTDLDRVSIRDGICEGYGDEPVEFAGDGAGVQLMVQNRRHSTKANLHVFHNGTAFSSVESFEIVDPRTGNSSFSTNFPNFGLPSGVEKLAVKLAETHRIVSPVNTSLTFDSDREITVHGAESTTMESKAIIWMADNDVRVKSNRSIVLVAPRGIYLDTMRLALAPTYHRSDAGVEAMQYKICICMPQGKLFRVPILSAASAVRDNCARIGVSSEHDPCA